MTAPRPQYRIPFRQLAIRDPAMRAELAQALMRVLDHGQMIMGEEVEQFETEFAHEVQSPHCVGVSSGTNALYLALKALGIGRGAEVITPALSWVATAAAIKMTGAVPVFVDIKDDLNLDPSCLDGALTARTAAIVPVHYCGRVCDMPAILKFAHANKLAVVEDAAQAFGAQLGDVNAGNFGDLAAFSINPMKPLRSLGEAGAITFKDAGLRAKLASLRLVGLEDREHCVMPELNHRLPSLQAAFIRVFLHHYPEAIARRREIANIYATELGEIVQGPPMDDLRRSVFFDYQIIADHRDELFKFLQDRSIEIKIRYSRPQPEHRAFSDSPRAHVPNTTRLVKRILSLPMEPNMSEDDIHFVCKAVSAFYRGTPRSPSNGH